MAYAGEVGESSLERSCPTPCPWLLAQHRSTSHSAFAGASVSMAPASVCERETRYPWRMSTRSWHRASLALDARTAAWYSRTGTAVPVGAPTAVDILAPFPPVRGLVFCSTSTVCGESREVGVLLAQAASSSAQRQWRSLGARSMLDARSFMISTLRSQVGFPPRGTCTCKPPCITSVRPRYSTQVALDYVDYLTV